ncbi:hypothetical protein CEXT_183851 [Caerostris extrusa]|uniref:Uncharacterized protein n=1 Tax=Caerostris extrusa TaxID=172846 RepID=A0AAV4NX65_CAEEX|nr:hypothetical protein CEXT_183851 [Caerostris extrusa]
MELRRLLGSLRLVLVWVVVSVGLGSVHAETQKNFMHRSRKSSVHGHRRTFMNRHRRTFMNRRTSIHNKDEALDIDTEEDLSIEEEPLCLDKDEALHIDTEEHL